MEASGLMARKSVDDIVSGGEAEAQGLSRSLGALSITAMGIGAIIGAGIFVLTGTAAAQYAGRGSCTPSSSAASPAPSSACATPRWRR